MLLALAGSLLKRTWRIVALGTALAASADSENLYPKVNFFFPVVLFAGIGMILYGLFVRRQPR